MLIGGVGIALGNALLAMSSGPRGFYLGLVVIVLGVGLLKPNVSAMVADLYPEGGARLDAGFTVFYMGINLGATLGPLVTGAAIDSSVRARASARPRFSWRSACVQYYFTQHHLGDCRRIHRAARGQARWPSQPLAAALDRRRTGRDRLGGVQPGLDCRGSSDLWRRSPPR